MNPINTNTLIARFIVQNEGGITLFEANSYDVLKQRIKISDFELRQADNRTIELEGEELSIVDIDFIISQYSIQDHLTLYITVKKDYEWDKEKGQLVPKR